MQLIARASLGAMLIIGLTALPAVAKGMAFVINSAEASVNVIDVETRKELRRIPVYREPHHMALTPDGRSLLIGDTSGNTLFSLDPTTGETQRTLTMADPYQLTFSPDTKWLTVAGLARNQIDIYDAATTKLAFRIPARTMPSHINYSPDSSVVYVSLQGSNSLIAIATATDKIVWNVKVGQVPACVLWHDGRQLVGIMGDNYVAVVNPVDGRVERKVITGRGAHILFVPPDGEVLYVSNRVDGTIAILDATSLAVQRTIAVPGGPDDMDFAPDGKV